MPNRINALTREQEAQIRPFAQTWVTRGLRTTPLTSDEWQTWQQGVQQCYAFLGLPFPEHNIIRVASPLAGALAAHIAAWWIGELRKQNASLDAALEKVRESVQAVVPELVHGSVLGSVLDAVRRSEGWVMHPSVRSVADLLDWAIHGGTAALVTAAVDDAVHEVVADAAPFEKLTWVGDWVHRAVNDSVGEAVRGAGQQELRARIATSWQNFPNAFCGRLGGYCQGSRNWEAYIDYFRDVVQLELDGQQWNRWQAFEDANSAGWWWMYSDFVMVCDNPTYMHQEQIATSAWQTHHLHCANGPAIAWADGHAFYAWHGTRVPAWVIEEPTLERAEQESNPKVRRAALEFIETNRSKWM